MWASAVQPSNTGAGVFQRELYRRLGERGITVEAAPDPSNRALRALRSFGRVVGRPYTAAIVCASPAPLVIRTPAIAVVYDLRWRRTRGRASRLYRYLDLRRMVGRADHILSISERTRDEVLGLFPWAGPKCGVLHLGPGSMGDGDFVAGDAGTVLLTGRADYKRNELVAEALVRARPEWAVRFLCVGVSDQAFQLLVDGFGATSCERFDGVPDDTMRAMFRRASVYVSASMEEGFGLPTVEALAAGCQVVAVRQPLTVEILGDAAVLLDDGDAESLAQQLRRPPWPTEEQRRARAAMFSWDDVADAVASALDRLGSGPGAVPPRGSGRGRRRVRRVRRL